MNLLRVGQGPVSISVVDCIDHSGQFTLNIYNSAGEKVRNLMTFTIVQPFVANYFWDGRNSYGEPCATGVYIIELRTPFSRKERKILLMR